MLGDNLKSNKVLFVSTLSCNLVSIARITKDLNCSVTFFDDCCILQDRTSRMPIGVGEQKDGFYYYEKTPLKIYSNVVRASELWHKPMGHPSSEIMSFFAKELGFSNYDKKNSDVCDVCFRAKQARSCFHISKNKANNYL